jgi:hypothetical protein
VALEVHLVTPEREVWVGMAEMLIAHGVDGDVGILGGHAPLLVQLAIGPVTILLEDGEMLEAVVDGGFLHVGNPIAFAFGDFNRDFHVDGADLDFFKNCVTGPGVPQTEPDCIQTDHDTDGDVDQDDFAAFQRCYSGPSAIANVACH